MGGFKTVVIDGYGVKVSTERGLLVIRNGSDKQKIGLTEIEQVVIATSGVSITSGAIRLLLRNNVDVVFLDSRGLPIGRIYPPYVNRTVDTRRGQYMLFYNDKASIQLVTEIMYSKIYNQAGHLRRLAKQLDRPGLRENAYRMLTEYLEDTSSIRGTLEIAREKIRIAEAKAAHIYWESLATTIPPELGFDSRKPGTGEDIVNRCLDYMYGLLYSEAWKALVLAGLDPYAGFMHVDRSGKPVLVYDFVEMFRPSHVDYPLFSRLRNGWVPEWKDDREGLLSLETRRELIKLFRENLDRKAGFKGSDRRRRLGSILVHFAFKLASYARGESTSYTGFQMVW